MKRLDFIQIPGFAIWGLHLTGNELLCFSLVYSLSHSKSGYFVGTQDDVAELLNISKRSAVSVISSLVDKGLIDKSIIWDEAKSSKISILTTKVQNLHFCGEESAEFAPTKVQNLHNPPIIYTNNTTNNNRDNICDTKVQNLHNPKQQNTQAQASPIPPVPATPLPFKSARFEELWDVICKMPKWKKKEQYALNLSLKKLSKYSEAVAIRALETAIENGWQGVFPQKAEKEIQQETRFQPPQPAPQEEKPKYRTVTMEEILGGKKK